MTPEAGVLMLLAALIPSIAVAKAQKGWFLRIVLFVVGFSALVIINTLILNTEPFQRMIWSGPDRGPILLAMLISIGIISVLSFVLYNGLRNGTKKPELNTAEQDGAHQPATRFDSKAWTQADHIEGLMPVTSSPPPIPQSTPAPALDTNEKENSKSRNKAQFDDNINFKKK